MIKNKIIGFWNESVNVRSITRLLASALVFTAIAIAIFEVIFSSYQYAWTLKPPYEIHTALILELGGLGVGGKIVQKIFGETQSINKDEENSK